VSLTNGSAGVDTVDASTITKVTFNSSASVTVPQGSEAVSDPIDFPLRTSEVVAITLYLNAGVTDQKMTGHLRTRTDIYMTSGDQTTATTLTGLVQSVQHWFVPKIPPSIQTPKCPQILPLRHRSPSPQRLQVNLYSRRQYNRRPRQRHRQKRPLAQRPLRAPLKKGLHFQHRMCQRRPKRQLRFIYVSWSQRALPHRPSRSLADWHFLRDGLRGGE